VKRFDLSDLLLMWGFGVFSGALAIVIVQLGMVLYRG
jgi:hypothetical protein